MRILASTFADGDDEKIFLAMRSLAYDRLALLVTEESEGPSLERVKKLEGLAGHEVAVLPIEADGFMPMVDSISEQLASLLVDGRQGTRHELLLNISGGTKIMGDAALLASFRLGIEAYHCDKVVIRLPVLKGATAKDRFTQQQIHLLDVLGVREVPLTEVIRSMEPNSKASAERTIRELRKQRLLRSRAKDGKVYLGLSSEGIEVFLATRFARGF